MPAVTRIISTPDRSDRFHSRPVRPSIESKQKSARFDVGLFGLKIGLLAGHIEHYF